MSRCPECERELSVADVVVGEVIVCDDCGAELELTVLEPPTLVLAPEIQEDHGE